MVCPKCGKEFFVDINKRYIPKFCSRQCSNSRTWSNEHKIKLSIAAKNSEKVQTFNRSKEFIERKRKKATEHLKGLHVLTKEDREKAVINLKRSFKEKRDKLDFSEKKNYRFLCQFRFKLSDYPEEYDFDLIKKYGWYSAPNKGGNIDGISRDHMLSIKDGWENNINPYKISHPANCRLVRHSENWEKRGKSIISEDELDLLIEEWNKKYGPVVI